MATRVIIDGYNLLPVFAAGLPFTDAALAQRELLKELAAYKKRRRLKIIVVWDSYQTAPLGEVTGRRAGIKEAWSAAGVRADQAIIRRVRDLSGEAVVVSNDREVRDACERAGASVLGCEEFLGRVDQSAFAALKGVDEDDAYLDGPGDRGPTKGNPRREKKSKRKKSKRIKKL